MKTRNDTGPARVLPGDIDHDFTDDVNRRQKRHRLAQSLQDASVPALLLLGAMCFGWFAHSIFHN